jgi:hypothetical protein
MNGPSFAVIRDAAVFSGELKRDFIVAAVVIGICLSVWAIQTFMERGR